MNLLQRAEILCLLSVLERFIYRKFAIILSVQRKLSVFERCPYGEVRFDAFTNSNLQQ